MINKNRASNWIGRILIWVVYGGFLIFIASMMDNAPNWIIPLYAGVLFIIGYVYHILSDIQKKYTAITIEMRQRDIDTNKRLSKIADDVRFMRQDQLNTYLDKKAKPEE